MNRFTFQKQSILPKRIVIKIKASTLMETLVATVLIVVIFMLSSLILNNLFYNSIRNNTVRIESYFNELRYFYLHDKITTPYYDEYNKWEISLISQKNGQRKIVEFNAHKTETGQGFTKTIYAD